MNEIRNGRAAGQVVLQSLGLGKRFVEGPLKVQVFDQLDLTVRAGENGAP